MTTLVVFHHLSGHTKSPTSPPQPGPTRYASNWWEQRRASSYFEPYQQEQMVGVWRVGAIIDKWMLETTVLLYCQQHFRHASTTPLGSGQLADSIGNAALTEECTHIINGMIPEAIMSATPPELGAFLAHLAIPEELRDAPPPSSPQRFPQASIEVQLKKWKEGTSTSPSGRHLAYYRATLT